MARIEITMSALGNEPQTCHRPFVRGETISAVVYDNGEPAGWHTADCVDYWKKTGEPLCNGTEAIPK